ncbi:hypothetical protein E4T38_09061 [Aureobasidium subglaciale]|nr:hypothetical protein E4T38_09061 [Aureobasidium subglaciale]KAI5217104.1 hypothetical protein E4T41_08988 [Aureobasidium subglaciale]KAI5223342.1 hypothetical protein E4T40_04580 [Aureobasidium subglaciale]KAI5254952.1 hypothetical protein E4T46_09022 [Aureobasidium subglaciale]
MDGVNQPPNYPPAPSVEDDPVSLFVGGDRANTTSTTSRTMSDAPKGPSTPVDGAATNNAGPDIPANGDAVPSAVNNEDPRTPINRAPSAPPVDRVQIVLKDQGGTQIAFGVKSSTRMERVQTAYAEKTGRPLESLRFFYEGVRVNPTDTVATLEMDNEDIIEVMTEQIGGGSSGRSDHARTKLHKYVAKDFYKYEEEISFTVNAVEVDGKWIKEMEFVVGPSVKIMDFINAWTKRAGCTADKVVFRHNPDKEGPGLPFKFDDETFGEGDFQISDTIYVSAVADEPINLDIYNSSCSEEAIEGTKIRERRSVLNHKNP